MPANTSSRPLRDSARRVSNASGTDSLAGFLSELHCRALLAVVSLDNVRWVMREHGIAARALVTAEFKARLQSVIRKGDGLFALSDDHVCLVFTNLIDHNHGLLAANKLETLFAEPIEIKGEDVPLQVTAGMASFDGSGASRGADQLYRIADIAREKAAARSEGFAVVTVEDETNTRASDLTPEFRSAMDQGLVTLDYQPKYRLSDGALAGAEALVRWRRNGMVVPPSEFLGHLSRDQIWSMTRYCIRRAVREMPEFPVAVPIALNIDPIALEHSDFTAFITKELKLWNVEPQQLAFEITESAAIDDYANTHKLLNALRTAGHLVAIDDFGTGQATLQHFRNLPADEIKIDRQFITNVVHDKEDANITQGIIEMAHRCNKIVVAEGIEDGHTVAHLIEAGCDLGQGFFLGMPMSREQFTTLLEGVDTTN